MPIAAAVVEPDRESGGVDGYNGENRNLSVSFWADATCLSEILSTKNEL